MTTRVFQTAVTILTLIAAGSATADSSGKWTSGQEAYSKVCAYCHQKGVGPVIKDMNKSPDVVTHFVRHGNRAMPAFRRTELDDATLASIINYINSGKQP